MKKLSMLMALVMLTVVFTSCNLSAQSSGTKITVVTPFGTGDGNHGNYMNALKAYEAATGNTVNDLSSISNEEWKAQVKANFEAGQEPDVLFYFTGVDADSLVKSGKMAPLSDIRKYQSDYASNMKDSLMPVSTIDGRQYAVPVNGYWEGLFINKKVLVTCGVEIPADSYTWDQFLQDCQTIKDKGYIPIACSLNEIPHYWFEYCTFNNGGLTSHTKIPVNSEDEIGKIWAKGFGDIQKLYEKGFFPENTNSITDNQANTLMTEDKAAFMIDGSWKIGWFQTNATDINDFTVTYVPAKGERRPTDIIGGISMGYYITKKAWDDPKKREACVKFVMAMTTDDVVSTFGATSVTALKNGTKQPENANTLVVSALAMTKGCTGIVSTAQDGLKPSARNALFADVKNIVTSTITPKEAIDHCLGAE